MKGIVIGQYFCLSAKNGQYLANKLFYWPKRCYNWPIYGQPTHLLANLELQMPIKNLILDILRNSRDPLSLKQIHQTLPNTIATRTLRRYLNELQQKSLIEFSGSYKSRRYLIKPKEYEESFEAKQDIFSKTSIGYLQKLQIPLYQRDLCGYNLNWLQEYIPNQSYYLSADKRKLLHECGAQNGEIYPAATYVHKIYERLLIDLSYNSSRLEGNTYSLADTKNLLLYGKSAADKLDSEKIMILNHKEAIRYLAENINKIDANVESIHTIHFLLSDDLVLPEFSGRVRNEAVKVSASAYIPIDNPKKLQEILQIIANKAQQILDPFEQSVFLLIHLSYLQAYIDVNKRLARLAANIPLIKNGLIPIAFKDLDVDDYRSAMIVIYEFNQIDPLTELYTWSYIRTAKEYKIASEQLNIDQLRIKYRHIRRTLLGEIIRNQIINDVPKYIKEYAKTNYIHLDEQDKFINDCLLDLKNLDNNHILGLGITKEELAEWRNKQKS